MNRHFVWLLLIAISFFSLVPNATAAPQDKARTWKSANGKFSIEASYQGEESGKLILKTTDGKTVRVPLDQLSEEDQKFAASLASGENPFEVMDDPKSGDKPWAPVKGAAIEIKWGSSWSAGVILEVQGDDAFLVHYSKYKDDDSTWDEVVPRERIREPGAMSEGSSGSGKSGKPAESDPGAKFPLTKADLSAAKKVEIGSPPWNLTAITPPNYQDLGKVKIKFPVVPEGMDSAVFVMNRAQTTGFFGMQNGVKERLPQLSAFDLKSGEILGSTEIPIPQNFFRDMSDDGSTLLSSSGSYWPKRNRVDRWKIGAEGKLEHLGGIELKQKVKTAKFTSTGTVMVADTWGQVTVWQMDGTPKALFQLPRIGMRSHLALSPDRRILFGSGPKQVFAIDLATGFCGSSIGHGASSGPIAITNDYKKIAMATGNQLLVWNNAGEKIADFYVPTRHSHLQWLDDRYLTSGTTIIDTQSRIELCKLASPTWYALDGRGDYWMFNPKTKMFGNAPAIMKRFELMVPDNLENYFVLKEGDTVALDISVNMPANERKATRENIERQLATRGVTINNQSEFRIKMTEKTSSESQKYRDMRTGEESTVTSQRKDRTASLVKGDMTLISYGESSGGTPGMIMRRGDESLQQAANANRGQSNFDFFKNFSLPEDIAIHPEGKPFSNAKFEAFK